MHCRPEVTPIIIERRMKKWRSILRCPIIAPGCSPTRARRNLLRLLARHEAIQPRFWARFGLRICRANNGIGWRRSGHPPMKLIDVFQLDLHKQFQVFGSANFLVIWVQEKLQVVNG